MARIRTIKPEFFRHERLAELPPLTRLLFVGLWTLADRFGRLEDRPKRIKVELLPYDAGDVDKMLDRLAAGGFIVRYGVGAGRYIAIPSFEDHQRINGKEAVTPETIPPPPEGVPVPHPGSNGDTPETHRGSTGEAPVQLSGSNGDHRKGKEGKGREGNGRTEGAARVPPPPDVSWGPSPAVKRRMACAFESAIGVDVQTFVHSEFVAKLVNAGVEHVEGTLRAWYADTETAWHGREIGEDAPVFWRKRFAEWRGVTATAAAPAPAPFDLDAAVAAQLALHTTRRRA